MKYPYGGRRVKPGSQLLREATRQPDGKLPKNSLSGSYDVKDRYLRGRSGGEAHPYYIPGGGKAKRG